MHNNHIGVIDDGINEEYFDIGELKYNIEIVPDLSIKNRSNYTKKVNSHGTTCAGIIKKYAPNAILSSVRIVKKEGKGSSDQLIRAIEWCIETGIKIISLCLCSVEFNDYNKLRKCINSAANKGAIIIAAFNNEKKLTFPAGFTNVIGVKNKFLYSENQYMYHICPCDGVEITASARHKLCDKSNSENTNTLANSYATPMITAIVHNYLCTVKDASLIEIKNYLYSNSVKAWSGINKNITVSTDWVEDFSYHVLCNCGKKDEYIKSVELCGNAINKNSETLCIEICDCIKDSVDIESFINNISENYRNIILINNSVDLHNYRVKGYVYDSLWYEKNIQNSFEKYLNKKKKIEVPVVAINGFDTITQSKLITRLDKMFKVDGSYSVCISSNSRIILYNGEYIPKTFTIFESIRIANEKYHPDIIFIATKDSEMKSEKSKENIDLFIVPENSEISHENVMCYNGEDKIDDLKKKILNRLIENNVLSRDISNEEIIQIINKNKYVMMKNV